MGNSKLNFVQGVDMNVKDIPLAYKDAAYLYSYNASGNIQYFGKAEVGTLSSVSGWQLRKFLYDTSINNNISATVWASGSRDYEYTWGQRLTVTFL